MKLSIVIPIYNEHATLSTVFDRLRTLTFSEVEKELIFVDDGSTDGSAEILRDAVAAMPTGSGVRAVFRSQNGGKGTAVMDGIAAASGDLIIVQDADLEYDPRDIGRLLAPFSDPACQVVFGSRLLEPSNRRHASRLSYMGGRLLTWATNLLFGTKLTDQPTCYKMIRTPLLRSLNLQCKRFEFCSEVTAKVARRNLSIVEVPVTYNPRGWAEGKKIGTRDFFEGIWVLLRERFRR